MFGKRFLYSVIMEIEIFNIVVSIGVSFCLKKKERSSTHRMELFYWKEELRFC